MKPDWFNSMLSPGLSFRMEGRDPRRWRSIMYSHSGRVRFATRSLREDSGAPCETGDLAGPRLDWFFNGCWRLELP